MKFHLQLNLEIYEYVQIRYGLINLSLGNLQYGTPHWWGCGTLLENNFGTQVMGSFNPSLRVITFVLLLSNFWALVFAVAGPYHSNWNPAIIGTSSKAP